MENSQRLLSRVANDVWKGKRTGNTSGVGKLLSHLCTLQLVCIFLKFVYLYNSDL